MSNIQFEKVILFWCECPPVYKLDKKKKPTTERIYSSYPSGVKKTDKLFNPDLGTCDTCHKKNKEIKRINSTIDYDKNKKTEVIINVGT